MSKFSTTSTEEELKEEREKLWDLVNSEVDNQIAEIKSYVNKK